MKRLVALFLFCGILSTSSIAQDPKSASSEPPAKMVRAHYSVRNADPVVLAEVVGKHFQGEAELLAAPAGSGNAILIRGSANAVPEVLKLLKELDHQPRTIEIEVLIAEVPANEVTEKANLADLAKAVLPQRITLTTVEGQPVTTTTGGSKPFVTGREGNPFAKGAVAQRSVSYREVGTTLKLTPRVGSDNSIALDLSFQDSRVRPSDAGDEIGAPAFETTTLNTRMSIPPGKSVAAQSSRAGGKAATTVSVVVVTARVVEPNAPAPKTNK